MLEINDFPWYTHMGEKRMQRLISRVPLSFVLSSKIFDESTRRRGVSIYRLLSSGDRHVTYSSRALFQACFVNLLQGYDLRRLKGFRFKALDRHDHEIDITSAKDRAYTFRSENYTVIRNWYALNQLKFLFKFFCFAFVFFISSSTSSTRGNKRDTFLVVDLKEVKTNKKWTSSRGLRFKRRREKEKRAQTTLTQKGAASLPAD